MSRIRSKARFLAVQAIYQWQMTKQDTNEIIDYLYSNTDKEKVDYDYFQILVKGVLTEFSMLDSYTTGGVLRPSSLRKITSAVKSSGAKTIFSGYIPANKSLKRISRQTGLPIASTPLYGEGIAPGKNAVSTATLNICTFLKGQGGRCDQASADQLSARWQAIR